MSKRPKKVKKSSRKKTKSKPEKVRIQVVDPYESLLEEEEIIKLGEPISIYEPLTKVHAAFHACRKRYRWLFGGNQASKTYTNMMDLAMLALEVHPFRKPIRNGVHWAGIESWDQVRDVLWHDYLMRFIPPWQISDVQYGQDRVPKKVLLVNNHTIEFKAFNQGRTLFQSRKIDSFHGDEQCHRDFKGIFQEIQARLMVKGGFLSWSMSPIMPQPELEDRIDDTPDTDDVFYVNLNWNRKSKGGYIEDNIVDDMIKDWAEEVQSTRVKGRFSSFFGSVYKAFNRKIHVIKSFEIPSNWELYRGFDFGFTNPFACYDNKTEILTENGWKLFKELNKKEKVATLDLETKQIIYQKPVKYIKQRYMGNMICNEPRVESANFCVTPNHQMIEVDRRNNKWKFRRADKFVFELPVGWDSVSDKEQKLFVVPHGKQCKTELKPVYRKDFAKFVGLWLADGSLVKSKAGWFVTITQKKHTKEVEAILQNLSWKYWQFTDSNGVTQYRITSKDLWSWLIDNTYWQPRKNKRVPREILTWGKTCLKNLLEGHLIGDGTYKDNKRRQHFSTCESLIDDLQEVCALLGMSTTIKKSAAIDKSICYILTVCKAKLATKQHMKIKTLQYDGYVYCVEVPNHTLIVRRGKRPMACGNCIWLARDPDNNIWYVYREYYKKQTGIREHIAKIKRLSGHEQYKDSYADPENAEDRSELKKAGISTRKAKKDVARGIEIVQSRLKTVDRKARLYIFSNCPHTAKEFLLYKYGKPTTNREASDVPIPKYDHTLDAIRYVIYSVERRKKKGRVIFSTC